MSNKYKIVLTGGPGGGKTTASDLFKREFRKNVSVVPEAATMLFSSGIERPKDDQKLKHIQNAIFKLQKNNELLFQGLNQHEILICDRGTPDGAAYWPDSVESFFKEQETSYDNELKEYQAVIFFETAAKGGSSFQSGNPYRTEDNKMAIQLDQKLQKIWSKHPNFIFIPNQDSFVQKIMIGIDAIKKAINELEVPV